MIVFILRIIADDNRDCVWDVSPRPDRKTSMLEFLSEGDGNGMFYVCKLVLFSQRGKTHGVKKFLEVVP